jgi:hypothetical protein
MTVLAEKPEGKRLEWSVQTGSDQAESRVKPVTDINTGAQFTQLIPIIKQVMRLQFGEPSKADKGTIPLKNSMPCPNRPKL